MKINKNDLSLFCKCGNEVKIDVNYATEVIMQRDEYSSRDVYWRYICKCGQEYLLRKKIPIYLEYE